MRELEWVGWVVCLGVDTWGLRGVEVEAIRLTCGGGLSDVLDYRDYRRFLILVQRPLRDRFGVRCRSCL